jgi:hypothetical protein
MKTRTAIALSALTFGAALAAVPSFAQTRGQPSGTAPQGQTGGCISFQTGCSDKPYPMAGSESGSPSSAQSGKRTGTQQSRPASAGGRINSARTSGNRARPSGEQVASGQRVGSETYGFGGPRRYYDYAPGMRVAGADRGAIARCATRFRSFDPATGTYMGFDGIRRPCP